METDTVMATLDLHELALAVGLEITLPRGIAITGIVRDSRRAGPGLLFCALAADDAERAAHIAEAAARGAAAIACAQRPKTDLPWLPLDRPRAQAALLAAAVVGFPARSLQLVGVTGTNGKTTVTMLIETIMSEAQRRFGLVGTIRSSTGRRDLISRMTTPDPEEMQGLLAEMQAAGCVGAALEISSHALDQERCVGLDLQVALFTRMTRDHLDYHGDVSAYHRAKMKLLDLLAPGGSVVVNADAEESAAIRARVPAGARLLSYGLVAEADISARIVAMELAGMDLEFREGSKVVTGRFGMIGAHNAENALAAVAAGRALGLELDQAVAGLAAVKGVPGRLEHHQAAGLDVVIDYAHSPDAFEKVLGTLHGLTHARLIVVFGCGGDRDRGKRPEMGAIAELLADRVILSDDNPRGENPAAIVMQIRAGMKRPEDAIYVPDRREAILSALDEAEEGDLVLLAGKGHENYQIVGSLRSHHEDRLVVQDWADWKTGRRGQAP